MGSKTCTLALEQVLGNERSHQLNVAVAEAALFRSLVGIYLAQVKELASRMSSHDVV